MSNRMWLWITILVGVIVLPFGLSLLLRYTDKTNSLPDTPFNNSYNVVKGEEKLELEAKRTLPPNAADVKYLGNGWVMFTLPSETRRDGQTRKFLLRRAYDVSDNGDRYYLDYTVTELLE